MILSALEQLLQDTMGLDATLIGRSSVERAARQRMLSCGLPGLEAYWLHLQAKPSELQELIDAVVVPETWFFRDRDMYQALVAFIKEKESSGVIRLLSLPCASGEEPYSIAISLLECGLLPERFRIDAIDISAKALAMADRAQYGSNSFRGTELGFRDTYFEPVPPAWRLSEVVRKAVYFQQGNILAASFLPGESLYDVIFCRNLLIYFDRPTQDRAVGVLRRLLKPDGILFVGSSETGLMLNHNFTPVAIPQTYAFRTPPAAGNHRRAMPVISRVSPPGRQRRSVVERAVASPTQLSRVDTKTPIVSPPPSVDKDGIVEAARLADQGHLDEAAEICKAQIRVHGLSADACNLMGLIRNAASSPQEAIQYFRKALYLDPNHYEAMAHLVLLLDKQGDVAGAQLMRKRLQRMGSRASQ